MATKKTQRMVTYRLILLLSCCALLYGTKAVAVSDQKDVYASESAAGSCYQKGLRMIERNDFSAVRRLFANAEKSMTHDDSAREDLNGAKSRLVHEAISSAFELEKSGELQKAVRKFRFVIEFTSENENARVFLGQLLMRLGRTREASLQFRKAGYDPDAGHPGDFPLNPLPPADRSVQAIDMGA